MVNVGRPDARFFGPVGRGMAPFRFAHTTTGDAATFRRRLEDYERYVQEKHHRLFKRVTAELLTVLVNGTPVGNPSFWKKPRANYVGGHARRNWQIKTVPIAAELAGTDKDVRPPRSNDTSPGIGDAVDAGYRAIGQLPISVKRAFVVNPVPYMERLNRGWSRQAPAGWIDTALTLVLNKYRKAT